MRREGGASRWIVEHDQAVVVPDVAEDPFVANSMLPEFGLQAYAGVPLTTGEQVIGVLYVMNQEPHSYSEEDLRFVSALASRAASAVIKAKLYEDLRFARDKLESQVTERTASLNVAVADLHRKNQALREAEMATRAERDFSHKLIQSLPGVFYLVNPERRFLRWNQNLEQVTGYSGDELRAMLAGQLFLPEELGRVTESFMTVLTSGSAEVEASFLTRDGRRIPYFFTGLRVMSGGVPCMVGVGVDISERKRAEALMRGHKQILERIATAAPLPVVLEELVRFVEAQDESLLCALQVLGPAGLHVRCVVAPSLPAEYNQAIENLPIGPCVGSCGTAAFRQEAVIVEDIATDPLWVDYRDLALAHGLRSCWSTPVFDATHKVLGTFAIYERRPGRPSERHLRLIDIATQVASIALSRVRDEQELRESELRHRLMAEIMAGYSFAYRIPPDGEIKLEWATRPMEQVIGYSEADLKEDVSFRGLIHPEDRSGQQAALERVMAGEPEIMEFRLRTKGGLWRWLRCYNRPEWSETERRVVRILGAAQDITDRKQAELELRRSETRLEEAQARAQLGSWELELAGLRGTWSAEMSRLHGRDPALGAPLFSEFLDLIHPEDRPLVVHVQAQLAASTQPISHEYRTHPTLGPVRHLAATVEVIRDASGQAVRAVGTTQDITGRKQAEQAVEKSRTQLRALLARLQRARELERTRIAREVHDVLGQLLTGFKMDLAWCERRVAKITEEPLRRALEEKLSGTTQLTDTMIESVQKISRELRPSVLDNLGLAAAIESEARQFQERSGIACQAVLPTEEFALEADRATEVFRIFQEALTNVARHAQATRVRIRLVRNADSLELEVADNGLGISEDKLSNAESLGLLGMRERAAAMGGEIQLGNAPEGGTTVRLTIPEKTV